MRKGKDMSSAELDVWVEKNSPDAELERFVRLLDLNSAVDDSSSNPAVLAIMKNILVAEETEEAIFAAANAGSISGQDFVDRPFLLNDGDISFRVSSKTYTDQGSFPWYVLMKVTAMDTGEECTVTCGGFSILTVLWRFDAAGILKKYEGGMPLIIKGKTTGSGNTVLLLHPYNPPKLTTNATSKKTKEA